MTRRKSVQEQLVKPLRKLSLLTSKSAPAVDFRPHDNADETPLIEQHDIVSLLPRELALQVFSKLPFNDLVRAQLVCRVWRHIAQDTSLWRHRYVELYQQYPDLLLHKKHQTEDVHMDLARLSWQSRYCQARTQVNWRMGIVQRLQLIAQGCRLLSVKLRQHSLVTLSEDNRVHLYHYIPERHTFEHKHTWTFSDQTVECVDILPGLHVMVVAMRGSKCMFYDTQKCHTDPIQVLKGGSHPWFVPDCIAIHQDYFVVSGRRPSAVFVWNWRKGVRLTHRALDNQPHSVYLAGNSVITLSVDGYLKSFDIHSTTEVSAPRIASCAIPCVTYDGSLDLVCVPSNTRRILHYRWQPQHQEDEDEEAKSHNASPTDTAPRQSLSSLLKRESTKRRRLRRRLSSAYNDYGYACQNRTEQYIHPQKPAGPQPDLTHRPELTHSIRTTPLGWAPRDVVSVAVHNDRVAIIHRQGHLALFALNGTTAAQVACRNGRRDWIETDFRDEDDLSDGYDSVRSRLAMGPMGILYGGRSGHLWWFDFGCRPFL